jgi:AcrR family transcriptional regulator
VRTQPSHSDAFPYLDPAREARLLRAAAGAFTADGYHQASLNRIIEAAGWAKSSFYHYFPDKQRLHDHLIATLRDRLAAGLHVPQLSDLSATTFWTEAVALVASLERVLVDDPDTALLVRMFDHPLAARGPEGRLTGLRRDVRVWVLAALQHGQGLGVVRVDVPAPLLVELLLALICTGTRWTGEDCDCPSMPEGVVASLLRDALAR